MRIRNPNTRKNSNKQNKSGTDINQKPHITVPYQRGLSESFKRTCNNHGVQVHFKGGTTIKNLLMAPKDQDPIKNRSGVIYRFKCNRVECDDEYIGESSRTFGERFRNISKPPPQSLTTLTPLVTKSLWKILVLLERGAEPHESH